jgi:virginiamycin B lyase
VSRHGTRAFLIAIRLLMLAVVLSAQVGIAEEYRRERPARAPAQQTQPHPSPANRGIARPGLEKVQVPFASLKPEATFKIGENADWVEITDDAVWVASSNPASVHRIDPNTNKEVAVIPVPGDPCAGLAFGFGSLWVPLCGHPNSMARVDASTNRINAILPIGPAGEEGGIATSSDSVWIVSNDAGTLVRIDPATNTVRQKISIAAGSYNPCFSDAAVWITSGTTNLLTAVDATTGDVMAVIPVGPKPRFLTAGGGSIWTLNQGDGTVTRIDPGSKKVTATIAVGIPGHGGDIAWGAGSIWATSLGVPLTVIDAKTNKVVRQWVGPGGDSLRFGHDSIWLTDYKQGTLSRIANSETLKSNDSR